MRLQKDLEELRGQLDQETHEAERAQAACQEVQKQHTAAQTQVLELKLQVENLQQQLTKQQARQTRASVTFAGLGPESPVEGGGSPPAAKQIGQLLESNRNLRQQVLDAEERARKANAAASNASRNSELAVLREELASTRHQLEQARQRLMDAEHAMAAQHVRSSSLEALAASPGMRTSHTMGSANELQLEAEVSRLKALNRRLMEQMEQAEHRIMMLQRSGGTATADAVVLQADLQALQRTNKQLRDQLLEAEQRAASLGVQAESWARDKASLQAQLEHVDRQLAMVKATSADDLDNLKRQVVAAQEAQRDAEQRVASLRHANSNQAQEAAQTQAGCVVVACAHTPPNS